MTRIQPKRIQISGCTRLFFLTSLTCDSRATFPFKVLLLVCRGYLPCPRHSCKWPHFSDVELGKSWRNCGNTAQFGKHGSVRETLPSWGNTAYLGKHGSVDVTRPIVRETCSVGVTRLSWGNTSQLGKLGSIWETSINWGSTEQFGKHGPVWETRFNWGITA